MTSCYNKWIPKNNIYNGKCKNYMIPPCWQGYNTFTKEKGKCGKVKPAKWYVRRAGTSYNSIQDSGPSGHPKANGFSPILFEKNVPVWLWLDNAEKRRNKNNKSCPSRCKGQGRLKRPTPLVSAYAPSHTSSKSVAPAFQSYETVLAVRKAKAYYEPVNYKKYKKWHRVNCRY
jgi:hypothetical protein